MVSLPNFDNQKFIDGMTDEEFVEKIRGAIEEGFKLAKGDLGEVPGPTGLPAPGLHRSHRRPRQLRRKHRSWLSASSSYLLRYCVYLPTRK